MGRNYEALGEYGAAREEYICAYYMVPCRLYPLVRLMRMEIALGNDGDEGLRKDVHSWQAIFLDCRRLIVRRMSAILLLIVTVRPHQPFFVCDRLPILTMIPNRTGQNSSCLPTLNQPGYTDLRG